MKVINKTKRFFNLKNRVLQHVESQTHKEKELEKESIHDTKKRPDAVNKEEAAMRCARLSHELIKMGRPFSDYPELVAIFVKNGLYMGDINHSTEFPANFLKSVASVVRSKIKETLSKKLKQTGHVRPCKIIADKDTTKHRTRQLICLTTIFPEAKEFIQHCILTTRSLNITRQKM